MCLNLSMNKNLLIGCKDISYRIKGNVILDKVNFDIRRGDIITIIGPNGAGKSTLAKLVAKVLAPTSGVIQRKEHLKIGYMPQKVHINNLVPITVKEFLFLNITKKSISNIDVGKIVEENYIKAILSKQVQDISGGEWQRLLLARILLRDPELLILDEPTQGLDVNGQQDFYSLLNQIKISQKKSILMISHDLHTVMRSSDNVLCLNKCICCSGMPEKIKQQKSYHDLFKTTENKILAHYVHHHKEN